jgi:hypothetical protein
MERQKREKRGKEKKKKQKMRVMVGDQTANQAANSLQKGKIFTSSGTVKL